VVNVKPGAGLMSEMVDIRNIINKEGNYV